MKLKFSSENRETVGIILLSVVAMTGFATAVIGMLKAVLTSSGGPG